jgi:lipopolysaccharide assembly outer membrane protein LptD (OstA)
MVLNVATEAAMASHMVITATKVTCEKEHNKCVAEGDVKVVQGHEDNEDDKSATTKTQTLTTDHLTVHFEPKKEAKHGTTTDTPLNTSPLGSSDIKEIHAKGNVMVVNGTTKITSKTAIYTAETDVIEFFDHVKINDPTRAYIESDYGAMNRKTGAYEVNMRKDMSDSKAHQKSQKVHIILQQKAS